MKHIKTKIVFILSLLTFVLSIYLLYLEFKNEKTIKNYLKNINKTLNLLKLENEFLSLINQRYEFLITKNEDLLKTEDIYAKKLINTLKESNFTIDFKKQLGEYINKIDTLYLNTLSFLSKKNKLEYIKNKKYLISAINIAINFFEQQKNNPEKININLNISHCILILICIISIILLILSYKNNHSIIKYSSDTLKNTSILAGIAHEIKNPLASIKANLSLLSMDFPKNKEIKNAINETDRLNKLLNEYLNMFKPKSWEIKTINLKNILDDIKTTFKSELIHKNINLNIKCNIDTIKSDPDKIKQIIINIVKNAIEAIKNNGKIIINAKKSNNNLIITIKNNGDKIPDEIAKKIFLPFFSNKKNGHGLGLFVCSHILETINGNIVYYRENEFTTFEIKIPMEV